MNEDTILDLNLLDEIIEEADMINSGPVVCLCVGGDEDIVA